MGVRVSVKIDGVQYVPVGTFISKTDELSKALIRALVSGYYYSVNCNVDGGDPKPNCDCSACRLHRVAIQVLGSEPPCNEEPLLEQLFENA